MVYDWAYFNPVEWTGTMPRMNWATTAASTTDILLELSNPGRWMIHCHIAEHLESGMKMVMNVAADPP